MLAGWDERAEGAFTNIEALTMPNHPPPPALDCARVIEYVVISESVEFSGHTLLFVDSKEIGRVPCLAICEEAETLGFLLFHCDDEWIVLGCSSHDSIEEAKGRAEKIYPGLSACWVNPGVTREQAEKYLDERFGEQRCSFCGKRADKIEHFVHRNSARICNFCIDEFHEMIHKPKANA